jgi:hypothetical protein
VKAHTAHGDDCLAAPKSTCFTTGECDGNGACSKWPLGTVCTAASCSTDGLTATKAATCDGAGACVGNGSNQCSHFACDTAVGDCKTSCTTAADCQKPYHCLADHTCGKAPDGEVCGTNDECVSGNCGGRCCPAGTTCTCPQPSKDNMLANPGFDEDPRVGWTVTIPPDTMHTVTLSKMDASGCPYSGSAQLFFYTVTSTYDPPTITQCLPVTPGTVYEFGFRVQSDCGGAWCTPTWLTAGNCTGDDVTDVYVSPENGGMPFTDFQLSGPITAPATSHSVLFNCTTAPPYGTSCATWFDELYFHARPPTY